MDAAVSTTLKLARSYSRIARRLDAGLGAHHGVGFSDYALLAELAHAPGGRLRPTDLAAKLHLTPSGVTRALLPLEKIGMIVRERNERDGRGSFARLTDAGRRVYEDATATVNRGCSEIFTRLSVGQTRQLARLLQDLH